MVYLGIDYGTKRIGLALATDETSPVPLRTLGIMNYESGIRGIVDIVKEESIDFVVVGRPQAMSGDQKKTAIEQDVDRFITDLQKIITIPIVTQDERMTSLGADALKKEFGGSGERDAVAAMFILESYLGKNKSKKLVANS